MYSIYEGLHVKVSVVSEFYQKWILETDKCLCYFLTGPKNGIIPPDEITRRYVEGRAKRSYRFYQSEPDASYREVYEIETGKLEPQVAFPTCLPMFDR